MKILLVLPAFHVGGAETMVTLLAEALAARGVGVGIASLYGPQGTFLEEQLEQSGVPITYVGKRRGPDPMAVARLARAVSRVGPDIVHTHQYALAYLAPLMQPQRGWRICHTMHNPPAREVSRVPRQVHRLAFRLGCQPVAIAQALVPPTMDEYGCASPPVIPNGIPVDRFESSEDRTLRSSPEVRILSVGRFEPQKRPLDMLRDVSEVREALGAEIRYRMIGEGALLDDLLRLRADLGGEDWVEILSPRPGISRDMAWADLYFMGSAWEGHPLVLLEAQASGLPVVARSVGGVSEIVRHGETGLLAHPSSPEGLSVGLARLIENREVRLRMGHAGAVRAKSHFSVEAMTRQYEDLYERMMARL